MSPPWFIPSGSPRRISNPVRGSRQVYAGWDLRFWHSQDLPVALSHTREAPLNRPHRHCSRWQSKAFQPPHGPLRHNLDFSILRILVPRDVRIAQVYEWSRKPLKFSTRNLYRTLSNLFLICRISRTEVNRVLNNRSERPQATDSYCSKGQASPRHLPMPAPDLQPLPTHSFEPQAAARH